MPVPKNTGAPPGTTPNIGALYIEHREKLIRTAASVLLRSFKLRDGDLDVVQQVFLELQASPPEETINNWEAFLVQCTRLRAIDYGRKQHVKKWGGSVEDEDFDLADPTSGDDIAEVDSAIDSAIRMVDVRVAMAGLSDRERHVIQRLELHGATRNEVAADLGVTPPRISQIRKAALEKVRAHIERDVTT